MRTAILIPARMESKRLPGKPLLPAGGKPVIQWTIDAARASKQATCVAVVTDSNEIVKQLVCQSPAIDVLLIEGQYRNGTERTARTVPHPSIDRWKPQLFVNLQCDEVDLTGEDLDMLLAAFAADPSICVATLACPLQLHDRADNAVVKIVPDRRGNAVYFSRWDLGAASLQHVGVYAIRAASLQKYRDWPVGSCEQTENLEQLRWLENGIPIRVVQLDRHVRSINTERDLTEFNATCGTAVTA